MAITNLASAWSDNDQNSYNTAVILPTAGALVILLVWNYPQSGTTGPAGPTGAGLTFEQIGTTENTGAGPVVSIWRAITASPSSAAIAIGFAGQAQFGCGWSCFEDDAADDTGGTNGDAAVVQVVQGSGASRTLAALGSADNRAVGLFGSSGSAVVGTEGTGFTLIATASGSGPSGNVLSQWRTNVTAVAATINGTARSFAIEIRSVAAVNPPGGGNYNRIGERTSRIGTGGMVG